MISGRTRDAPGATSGEDDNVQVLESSLEAVEDAVCGLGSSDDVKPFQGRPRRLIFDSTELALWFSSIKRIWSSGRRPTWSCWSGWSVDFLCEVKPSAFNRAARLGEGLRVCFALFVVGEPAGVVFADFEVTVLSFVGREDGLFSVVSMMLLFTTWGCGFSWKSCGLETSEKPRVKWSAVVVSSWACAWSSACSRRCGWWLEHESPEGTTAQAVVFVSLQLASASATDPSVADICS